jgi:hypothetical protein
MPPGPAADAQGRPAIDPTVNVSALVESATKRLDDLRECESKHFGEMLKQQADFAQLRAHYEKEIRLAESARIDAIRAVDVAAAASAALVAEARATVLANTVNLSAEALRTQVAATAQAQVENQAKLLDPINLAVSSLRQTQFEQQGQQQQIIEGRAAAVDNKPVLDAIAKLVEAQSASVGARAQMVASSASRTLLIAGLTLGVAFLGMLSTALGLYLALKR